MTIIKLVKTTPEYKKGFRAAMKMILKWCENGSYKEISDLEISLRGGLMLDELMEKEMTEK